MNANIVGSIILQRFRVDAYIASGGMGAVFKVWDLQRNVPLAMKILHNDLADDPSALNRFEREARALKKLAHPNIVPFYGFYEADGFVFIVEQFIDGLTLKEVLQKQRGKPVPVQDALVFLRDISAALGYAHSYGVIHCDIKPGNVMIDSAGRIYLTDFGVARHAESTDTTYSTAGTAAYMAPEQVRGDPVTARTDIYELGILLFELLTGQRPFRAVGGERDKSGSSAAERIRQAHLLLPPPDPRDLNPSLSPAISHVVLCALEKDPQNRFASAQEFFLALCRAAETTPEKLSNRIVLDPALFHRGSAATGATDAQAEIPPAPVPQTSTRADQKPGGRTFLWAFLTITLILVAGGIFFLISNRRAAIPHTAPALAFIPGTAAVTPSTSSSVATTDTVLSSQTNTEEAPSPVRRELKLKPSYCVYQSRPDESVSEILDLFDLRYDSNTVYFYFRNCYASSNHCTDRSPTMLVEHDTFPTNAFLVVENIDDQEPCESKGGLWIVEAPTPAPIPLLPTSTAEPTVPVMRDSARVLWDASHGPRKSHDPGEPLYDATGMYSALVNQLGNSSISVDNNDRDLDTVNLSDYQVVVINEWSAVRNAYDDNDATILRNYVAGGGGLLILADHSGTSKSVAVVCQAFGAACYQSPNVTQVTLVPGMTIANSVSELAFGYEGGTLSVPPAASVVGDANGSAAVITIDGLPGRVVIIGDGNLFDNNNLPNADNKMFAMNVFRWLAGMEK